MIGVVSTADITHLTKFFYQVFYSSNIIFHVFCLKQGEALPDTLGKPGWLKFVQTEMKACQDAIGLIDLSSQSLLEVSVRLRSFQLQAGQN